MKKVTPLLLLFATTLIWSACTPTSEGGSKAIIGQEPTASLEKITEQENKLESVGLKFVTTESTQEDSVIHYVSWDSQVRQAWLESHATEDIVLQIEELKVYLGMASDDEELTEDDVLPLKIDLAQKTLDQLER